DRRQSLHGRLLFGASDFRVPAKTTRQSPRIRCQEYFSRANPLPAGQRLQSFHPEKAMPRDLVEQMTALRPRLHRFAARMMGSAFEGEDVVQDAMAKLVTEDAARIADVEAWMFRVTHTCAIDALRRRRRQAARDARAEIVEGESAPADRRVAVAASLATF